MTKRKTSKRKKRSPKRTASKKKFKRKLRKTSNMQLAQDIIVSIIISFLLFFFIGSRFFSVETVNKSSMSPTIKLGDRILYKKGNENIKRFDIIAFKGVDKIEFQRVIGLPGEEVKYFEDQLQIDGQLIDETFISKQLFEYERKGEVFTQSQQEENGFQIQNISEGYYLLLGDNRPNSTDSRHFGLVSEKKIIGEAIYSLKPLKRLE